jgi:hypothetical protein
VITAPGRPRVPSGTIVHYWLVLPLPCGVPEVCLTCELQRWAKNHGWGYQRIRGELLKLGHRISASTIRRVLRALKIPPAPQRRTDTTWRKFLHTQAATMLATGFSHANCAVTLQRLYCPSLLTEANAAGQHGPVRGAIPSRRVRYVSHLVDDDLHVAIRVGQGCLVSISITNSTYTRSRAYGLDHAETGVHEIASSVGMVLNHLWYSVQSVSGISECGKLGGSCRPVMTRPCMTSCSMYQDTGRW